MLIQICNLFSTLGAGVENFLMDLLYVVVMIGLFVGLVLTMSTLILEFLS